MAKEVELPNIGRVVMTKRRTSRHIRLRVGHDGVPHVSLPLWLSYGHALDFISSKEAWIRKQQQGRLQPTLTDGSRIGKSHVLRVRTSAASKVTTRIAGNEAVINTPAGARWEAAADRLAIRVLKLESEALLPQRLEQLASQHGFHYSDVKISKMRSRWGSCNSHKLITLNCYLIQLPWHLIDYVLLHELAHTQVMAHNEAFWELLASLVPDVKERRRELKTYHTQLQPVQP